MTVVMQHALFRQDSENSMTPARRERLQRQFAAMMAAKERASKKAAEEAWLKSHGVLPADSERHMLEFDGSTDCNWVGGILTTDGRILLFNRYETEHEDFADEFGLRVRCGGYNYSTGTDGWGFYVECQRFSRYYVPQELAEEVERVLLEHGYVYPERAEYVNK